MNPLTWTPRALRAAVLCAVAALPAAAMAHAAGPGASAPGAQPAAAMPLPDVDTAALARLVPAQLPDLDAAIAHEIRQLGGDGVLRITRYEERLVRRGGHVWTERVLPPGTPAGEHAGEAGRRGGHQHLDLARAARHLQRDGDRLAVEFVDARHRLVVAVPEPEWDNVSFDGSWERAAMLLSANELGRLRPLQRAVPSAGLQWRGLEARGRFTRVLWDPVLGIARRIESGSADGAVQRTVIVTPSARPASGAPPWQRSASFERKGYSDLLD